MRRMLSALMLLGLTATAVAQTTQAPQHHRGTMRIYATGQHIVYTAGQAHPFDGSVDLRLSGGVRLTIDGTVVTADDATVDVRAREVRLGGNVRLELR